MLEMPLHHLKKGAKVSRTEQKIRSLRETKVHDEEHEDKDGDVLERGAERAGQERERRPDLEILERLRECGEGGVTVVVKWGA
jgi:hypothetical protein